MVNCVNYISEFKKERSHGKKRHGFYLFYYLSTCHNYFICDILKDGSGKKMSAGTCFLLFPTLVFFGDELLMDCP